MTILQHPDRRSAQRISKALKVVFSVNGGPPVHESDTINFTARSVAIRSDCPVSQGDRIIAWVDDLPEIEGAVVRVFDEGFALRLSDASLALVAHGGKDVDAEKDAAAGENNKVLSPVFRIDAPAPAWAQITTCCKVRNDIHYLTVVTSGAMDTNDVGNVWIGADDARWTARIVSAKNHNDQATICILLNDWQLRMAAKNGLDFTILSSRLKEWQAHIHPQHIKAHVDELPVEPEPQEALRA